MTLVAQRVREGQGFAATLLDRKVVPDVAIKMIEVGESTGALQEMLNSLADFYDEEIETEVGRFVTVIEPALLIVMGVVISVIVLALYLPLFELTSVIGGCMLEPHIPEDALDPTALRRNPRTKRRPSNAASKRRRRAGWPSAMVMSSST